MLQQFLDIGMLNIGENDEKLVALHSAAQDLASELTQLRQKVIPYTLVALDPDIDPDEPVLDDVEVAVKKHWATFRNRFTNSPREILRAILFESLERASETDHAVAAIVWLTGRNYLPYAQLGRERQLCSDFLLQMGETAETQATEEWSVVPAPGDSSSTAPNIPLLEVDLSYPSSVRLR